MTATVRPREREPERDGWGERETERESFQRLVSTYSFGLFRHPPADSPARAPAAPSPTSSRELTTSSCEPRTPSPRTNSPPTPSRYCKPALAPPPFSLVFPPLRLRLPHILGFSFDVFKASFDIFASFFCHELPPAQFADVATYGLVPRIPRLSLSGQLERRAEALSRGTSDFLLPCLSSLCLPRC